MKFLESTEKVTAEDKNGENVPKLYNVDAILMHWNVGDNNYFRLVPDKQFGQLITIAPHSLTMLKETQGNPKETFKTC